MQLIKSISIKGFRSIRNQTLGDLGNLTALVGKNSSGKSNVLRALNLFFNQQIEPNKPLSFSRDHSQTRTRSRTKKQITIAVEFAIPSRIRYRKELAVLTNLGKRFTITRTWELDARRAVQMRTSATTATGPIANDEELATQFLNILSYRYIPNRSVPAELLKHESQSLADAVFQRMKGDTTGEKLLKSLSAASGRLLKAATKTMTASSAPLSEPGIATAESIGQMIRMTGFQAIGQHGAPVQDEDWGAGHQSFYMYQVLHALDRNYGNFFGWRQATIWGVEEPEAALHRDLETQLINCLREWSQDDATRLQIIQTTHSSVATMGSDCGYFVELSGGESTFAPTPIPCLTRASQEKGISGWTHPALSFPWNPVVICEGPTDARVLGHVSQICNAAHLRFLPLTALDEDETGNGVDSIISYIKKYQTIIGNRPKEAPLLVLFDWEVSKDAVAKATRAFGESDKARKSVIQMDANLASSDLGPDFRGIERFYPPDVIRQASAAGEIHVADKPGKPMSVSSAQLAQAKAKLSFRVIQITDTTRLATLIQVVNQIQNALRDACAAGGVAIEKGTSHQI